MDNVGSQQEGKVLPRSEITEQSATLGELNGKAKREIAIINEPMPKAAIGKAKRQSNKKQDCQNAKPFIQLSIWDL
jgi:hypothetical protein